MTFAEWFTRLARPQHINGIVIALADGDWALRMLVPMDLDQVQLWCVNQHTWPSGEVHIWILPLADLHATEVLGHAGQDWAIRDGDEVCINGRSYGEALPLWVTATKKLGDASPYPFDGIVLDPSRRQGQLVQFAAIDVIKIRRLEQP